MVDQETAYSKYGGDFSFGADQFFVYKFPIANDYLFGMKIFIFSDGYWLVICEDAPGGLGKGEVRDSFKHPFHDVAVILGEI
jgi:hypothetical protein